MGKVLSLLLLLLISLACFKVSDDSQPLTTNEKPEPQQQEPAKKFELNDSLVVAIFTSPPGSEHGASGTGIVVDKKNGLILTARHGVYPYDKSVENYKYQRLFKNIRVFARKWESIDGYVVHLSESDDLALIKVDRQFEEQASFIATGFMAVKNELEFQGYPEGSFRILKGYITSMSERHLDFDMSVVGGMSGGPVLVPGRGIVGVVLLKQPIGGTALRSEQVKRYLDRALPTARSIKKVSGSFCLKRITFSETLIQQFEKDNPEIYAQFLVSDKKIFKTNWMKVTGNNLIFPDCINEKNKFKITILPGDKLEFKIVQKLFWPLVKDIFEDIIYKRPKEGLPDLVPKLEIGGNTFYFARVRE